MKRKLNNMIIILTILILSSGCAPTFNDFQRADTVGKNNISITPFISTTSSEDFANQSMNDGQSMDDEDFMMLPIDEDIQDSKGFKFAYGLTDKIDFNMKYESVEAALVDGSVLSIGLKTMLMNFGNNRYSLNLLFSSANQNISALDTGGNEDNDIKYIEPTILGSSKINNLFDFNYSFKILSQIDGNGCNGFFDCPESETGYASNFSIAYDIPTLEFLTFIAEYGILNLEESTYNHIGYAISFDYSKFKKSKNK